MKELDLKIISFSELYESMIWLRYVIRFRSTMSQFLGWLIFFWAILLGVGYRYYKPVMAVREYAYISAGVVAIIIYVLVSIAFFSYLQSKYDLIARYIDITYEKKLERG